MRTHIRAHMYAHTLYVPKQFINKSSGKKKLKKGKAGMIGKMEGKGKTEWQ